jgi:hypothetical protein
VFLDSRVGLAMEAFVAPTVLDRLVPPPLMRHAPITRAFVDRLLDAVTPARA